MLSPVSRDRSSPTAPSRVYMSAAVRAASSSGGMGRARMRRRRLQARYSSPCISTSRLRVWCGFRLRTLSKTAELPTGEAVQHVDVSGCPHGHTLAERAAVTAVQQQHDAPRPAGPHALLYEVGGA